YDKNSPAHASLTASVVIPYAGDWSVSVTQGTYNVQHFFGSPHLITVAAAATDPASCVVEFPEGRSITAGSSFEASVKPFDEFKNPTSHPEDSFKSRVELGNSEENFLNRHVLPENHTFSELQTAAGARRSNVKLGRMESNLLGVERSQSRMKQEKAQLEAEKEELEEEVRLKKHSEEELKVMVSALEAVSKERQDELKEVMMESKELKIDKLLGKGGFGVVNLATYRGTKVAMKQLLTVNEENVLRFRHECFLMKNLSHPNVVKLVGVSWSEELFACCLEFAENGSLEDWLRHTVGGKKYVATKKPVIGKGKNKKPKKKRAPLTEVAFKGFDYHGEHNPAEVTETDKERKAEAEALLHEWWMQRMNPKMGFEELLKEDKSRLDHGVSGYHAYTSSVGLLNVPIPIPTVSDRESLYRAVNIKDDAARSFSSVSYTIEDERRPPLSGKESVIHRDLKPDNMLLTRDWTLKLTDFGEARAQNMGGTMTSVGTPIYISPEVMRADHYDEKADTWSYGLCLVAMIRAERTLEQFFYQVLLF
ncbi:hypothetical protein TeGR_g6885, partial [Tetraparma gracilis]